MLVVCMYVQTVEHSTIAVVSVTLRMNEGLKPNASVCSSQVYSRDGEWKEEFAGVLFARRARLWWRRWHQNKVKGGRVGRRVIRRSPATRALSLAAHYCDAMLVVSAKMRETSFFWKDLRSGVGTQWVVCNYYYYYYYYYYYCRNSHCY